MGSLLIVKVSSQSAKISMQLLMVQHKSDMTAWLQLAATVMAQVLDITAADGHCFLSSCRVQMPP